METQIEKLQEVVRETETKTISLVKCKNFSTYTPVHNLF